jgi:hypothetical protein
MGKTLFKDRKEEGYIQNLLDKVPSVGLTTGTQQALKAFL